MDKLYFTLGENLGELLFQTAQEYILQGNIDKAFSLYKTSLHGFTDEYVMKVLKNEMVLVTDDSGEEMNLTNDLEAISSNKKHVYNWSRLIKERCEQLMDDIKIAYIGKCVLGYYRIVRREVERGRRKRYIETKFELTYSGDKAFYQEYDDLDTAKKEADKDMLRRISECLGIGKIEKPVGYSGCAFDGHGYTDEQMKR